ncbi:hypothetical protein SRHO_G00329880 [Serrasalmus rhombeus]
MESGKVRVRVMKGADEWIVGRCVCWEESASPYSGEADLWMEERSTLSSPESHQSALCIRESELQNVLQGKTRLNVQLFADTQKTAKYEQVQSEYERLRAALCAVTVERDCALWERTQLQGKLENLEQVLKHMREAAERRQQLELEHEQALAVLSAKQQEIDLLQKAQVEAKKEHEGAVHLLEAKVRELEERCRTQSEQFNLLSKELEKFRLQAGKFDILSSSQLSGGDSPGSPTKTPSLSQLLNGLAAPAGKGNEGSLSKSVISEFIRPLQMSGGEKSELLSVKPSFLSRSTPSSPRRAFLSEVRPVIAAAMDKELNLSPRAKPRYTGKVRLCVARYNYNPYDGPNEHPEAELPLVAGKYLYIYGTMDEDGFYEGELLDGQQGLVPSNFVDFVQDEDPLSTSLSERLKESSYLNHSPASLGSSSAVSTLSTLLSEKLEALGSCTGTGTSSSSGVSSLGPSLGSTLGLGLGLGLGHHSLGSGDPLGPCSNGSGTATLDLSIDEIGEDVVPYPRRITLIKQLAKSVIVSWDPPVVPPGWGSISGYNVLVDQEVRMSVPFGTRTKSLIEKLNLATCAHRISVQSVTDRGPSDPLRCMLLVGKDAVVAPHCLRVDNVTQTSAELSWMPSNSNYSHSIFLNDAEYDVVKPGSYRYRFYNLKPVTMYKVRVVAKPHQMPWQLPLEQREKREISVEFCTQAAGPPFPPQDVQVQSDPSPGVLQVRWKPPSLTPSGTSNGASVIGYVVCTKGQKIAEVMYPTAEYVTVEVNRIQCLEAREVVVRTISAQGESQDSNTAAIPHNLLGAPPHSRPPPHPQPHPPPPPYPQSYPPTHPQPHLQQPVLEPPPHPEGRRSPSPQRILPQPQGAPIPNTVARAMARQAAQRNSSNNRTERRNIFSERSNALHSLNSDEEEDGYDSPHARRRGASVDEFLRGSELGRHHHHYSHSEEYYTESSRGSDLSDIMEEDEEELYSEMQLEEGRRRSINSHNTLKAYYRRQDLAGVDEQDSWDLQREVVRQRSLRSHKRLHSIPEVAEEELPDAGSDVMGQRLRFEEARPGTSRVYQQDQQQQQQQQVDHLSPGKGVRRLQRQRSSPRYTSLEGSLGPGSPRGPCWSSSSSRQTTKSPDSGLDCGSEEEGSLGYRGSYHYHYHSSPLRVGSGPNMRIIHSEGPVERRALAAGRKRTLTRQSSVEEDFLDAAELRSHYYRPHHHLHHHHLLLRHPQRRFRSEGRLTEVGRSYSRDIRAHSVARLNRAVDEPLILGNPPPTGRSDRLDQSGRRTSHGCPPPQRRPMMVPSIDGYGGRDRRSLDYFEESELDDLPRIFVALFDYDPLSMSPNPDAAVEELPFKEGQIIKVFGEKDTDGFYRAEICGRRGLIPCNMVSEIQTEDDEMMEQLLKQGFLPLNTPVEKIERNRRSGRHPVSTRRMVALYDYDPRESSPNVDVEAELTFCAGDVITVFGEIDEDGFYYGELNGHKGLVPSNFLEEVPDDVEVYLTEPPSRHPQDHPGRTKTKRAVEMHLRHAAVFFVFPFPSPAWQTRRRAFISLRNGSVHLTFPWKKRGALRDEAPHTQCGPRGPEAPPHDGPKPSLRNKDCSPEERNC